MLQNIKSGTTLRVTLRIKLNPQFSYPCTLKENLLKVLIDRAKVIREEYPHKKIRCFNWLFSDDNEEMDFFLSQGFAAHRNCLVMKYDLTQNIPDVPKPEGIIVINRNLDTEEELKQYHEAESIAFSGIVWSMNLLRWYRGAPEWTNFSAFCENQLVGNTMTWMITEERSAIENIFILPEWRKRGVAKYMITEALKCLKSQGKSIATLSVHGDNKKAISLYMSMVNKFRRESITRLCF